MQAIAQTFLNRTHVIYQDKGTLFDFNLLTFLMSDWVKIKAQISPSTNRSVSRI
ncbi:hypothetical protein LBBP_01305 [Leptospira borgpetersenii serovar Ballum]|uniref:Uncharacterized protein n=1 Tax=Leptospira borgpetersenii serovar Ballum TaxID=280505 RepID=A0A0S2IPK6_LEPBO|nr:hypothetical protein LBBP_01305 [Leptospira borgpetersenii serovar Ballum]